MKKKMKMKTRLNPRQIRHRARRRRNERQRRENKRVEAIENRLAALRAQRYDPERFDIVLVRCASGGNEQASFDAVTRISGGASASDTGRGFIPGPEDIMFADDGADSLDSDCGFFPWLAEPPVTKRMLEKAIADRLQLHKSLPQRLASGIGRILDWAFPSRRTPFKKKFLRRYNLL